MPDDFSKLASCHGFEQKEIVGAERFDTQVMRADNHHFGVLQVMRLMDILKNVSTTQMRHPHIQHQQVWRVRLKER